MFNLLSFFRKKRIWDFDGGIHPPEMKIQSNSTPLRKVSLPSRFIVPLKQHIGEEGVLCVKPGDWVLRGQSLTFGYGHMLPIHAPTSGKVIAILSHPIASSSRSSALSIIIQPDGKDCWIKRDGWSNYYAHSREALIDRIHQFGVAGLGGTGFPTALKLRSVNNKIETLIINAAECEPYITADDRLIQECAMQIVEGIRILTYILQPRTVLIGIEDNKFQAISILRTILKHNHEIALCVIPTKYPSGSANQLIQILTGKQVPPGAHSFDVGILIQNVSTVFAVKRAIINGEPLTERVVTLTGKAISKPGNVWARLGSPIRHLLEQADFCQSSNQKVIMGGPLMGLTLSCLDIPVVKTTNCLLAPSIDEINMVQEEKRCIRCGTCADVCPVDLLPQQLYWYSKSQQHDKVTRYHLSDCIECGACSWVCPSNIPLVQYFRHEKTNIYSISMEKKRSAEAKIRFEARQARLERYKHLTVESVKKDENSIKAIQGGIAKQKVAAGHISADLCKTLLEASIARAKARKAAQQELNKD